MTARSPELEAIRRFPTFRRCTMLMTSALWREPALDISDEIARRLEATTP